MLLTIVTMLHNRSLYFSHLIEILYPLPTSPQSLMPQAPLTTILLSIFMNSTFLYSTYKWDHAVFIFPCLVYFTYHYVLHVHLCYSKWQEFLLFKGWLVFHCVCIYYCIPFQYALLSHSLSSSPSLSLSICVYKHI